MASESSFDIVSKLDKHEIDNAINQASKEVKQRFDFRNTDAEVAWSGDNGYELTATTEERVKAVLDVFQDKLVKRGVSLKVLDTEEPRQSGSQSKIRGTFKEGISTEDAKKVGKLIRDESAKGVKVQIQGDELRVSSKSRDDLQAVQALVKGADLDFAVQFTNYR
jgi:uncharacterized protein YajQ (UPF0234 family)